MKLTSRIRHLVSLLTLAIVAAVPAGAATVFVVNLDQPGEGLNDPTPYSPGGGNTAGTLGEARLQAVELATAIWANTLSSDVPVEVGVRFEPLGGTPTSATLGYGGAESVYRDFAGAAEAGVWYPSPLANKLAGLDLDGGTEVDVTLTFNSDVDGSAMGSTTFYYGLDADPPSGDVDFVAIAVHELTHGLGFNSLIDLSTGARFLGYDDAFSRHLEHHGASPADFPSMTDAERLAAITAGPDLHWVGPAGVAAGTGLIAGAAAGGHLVMYAPSSVSPGSSVDHFDPSMTPNQFMEPAYLDPALLFELPLAILDDLGWGAAPVCEGGTL